MLTGDGWGQAFDRFVEDITWAVGSQALSNWHHNLDQRLRHPTGYYEAHLMVERMAPDRVEDHDQRMIYGPWLEGTGSRNNAVFPGYRSAREATQKTDRDVPRVVAPYVEQLMRRLNGGG